MFHNIKYIPYCTHHITGHQKGLQPGGDMVCLPNCPFQALHFIWVGICIMGPWSTILLPLMHNMLPSHESWRSRSIRSMGWWYHPSSATVSDLRGIYRIRFQINVFNPTINTLYITPPEHLMLYDGAYGEMEIWYPPLSNQLVHKP